MNSNDFYKSKYSKYKNKYLELKQKNLKINQEGGTPFGKYIFYIKNSEFIKKDYKTVEYIRKKIDSVFIKLQMGL
jgi:hypothetical protein